MKNSIAQCLIFIIVITVAPVASGSESVDSINLGLGGLNPMAHCDAKVYIIEYEHLLTPTITILGRGSGVHYRYDNRQYLEDGRLRGMDVGARYYSAGGMQGFFVGGSLGYWTGDRTFIQYQNTPVQWQGKGNSDSIRLNFDLGDRIQIRGTNISIMPEASLGKYFSSLSCEATAPASRIGTPCNQKSEVNYYIFIGMTVGVAF